MSSRCKVRVKIFAACFAVLNVFLITLSHNVTYAEVADLVHHHLDATDTIPPKKKTAAAINAPASALTAPNNNQPNARNLRAAVSDTPKTVVRDTTSKRRSGALSDTLDLLDSNQPQANN